MLAILSIACIDPTALSGGRKQRKKKKTTKTKGKVIAEKLDEDLWEQAQNDVCKKSEKLCDPSARKMQHATRRYKELGGRYAGEKSESNSLARWTRQKWRTRDGRPSRGRYRYLPDEAWDELSEKERDETDAAKRRGTRRGKQWVANPKAAREASRRARNR